jgi:hypothetical protein
MKFKHIKEFKEVARDYEYIQHRLKDIYDIDATRTDLEAFEQCSLFKEEMSDQQYVVAFVKHDLGCADDEESVQENIAVANAGNTSGMGAVVSAQVGAVPGTTGTTGSGDIGSGWAKSKENNRNVRSRDSHLPRSRRKTAIQQMKTAFKQNTKKFSGTTKTPFDVKHDNTVDYSKKNAQSNIKSFSAFCQTNDKKNENYDDDTVTRLSPEEIKKMAKGDFKVHPMFSNDKNIFSIRSANNNQNNADLRHSINYLQDGSIEHGGLESLVKELPKHLPFLREKDVQTNALEVSASKSFEWFRIYELDDAHIIKLTVSIKFNKQTRSHFNNKENTYDLWFMPWITPSAKYPEDFNNELKIFMDVNQNKYENLTYQEVIDKMETCKKLYYRFAGYCLKHFNVEL